MDDNTVFHTTAFKTDEQRLAAANLPIIQRQRLIKTILYPYPKFKDAQAFIKQFHKPVEGGVADHGCIAGIVGQSRAGRSCPMGWCNWKAVTSVFPVGSGCSRPT